MIVLSAADSASDQTDSVEKSNSEAWATNDRLGGAEGGSGANEVSSSSSTSSSSHPLHPTTACDTEGAADASSYNQDIVPDISKNNKWV